jgi:hypothetical protein
MPKSNVFSNAIGSRLASMATVDPTIIQAIAPAEQIAPIGNLGVLPVASLTTQALAASSLGSTPVSQPGNLSTLKPNDVYSFSLTGVNSDGTGNINLSLNHISAGDDADLVLFRDSNNNGVLDGSDAQVASSYRGSNLDDSINVRTAGGNYFARVQRYAPGSTDDVQYRLDLSTANPSNLFPQENSLGRLSSGNRTFSGYISDQNTSDIYSFSQSRFRKTAISLSGLSNDADVRVIKDLNRNQIFDAGDRVVGSSTRGGAVSESVSVRGSGDYLVQVYQYSGATNYTLGMNTSYSVFS